jgi:BarA-like signal transduction histidine kinase
MTLLILCSVALGRSNDYDFGSLPSESEVNAKDFKQTGAGSCIESLGDDKCSSKTEVLSKAKQYNIWNKNVYQRSN